MDKHITQRPWASQRHQQYHSPAEGGTCHSQTPGPLPVLCLCVRRYTEVFCAGRETSKRVNQCERNKDQVTSLAQKPSFMKRTGLFCFARQRRHTHAVLFQTPSLSSVPTASIFHMQQINFTFSAGFSSRDQPTSWYFLFSFYICRSILNKKLCVLQNMSASNTEEECDIFLPRIFWLTREKVYNLTQAQAAHVDIQMFDEKELDCLPWKV